MARTIQLNRAQVDDILRALNGTRELLKALPSKPENHAVTYAIASNLTAIEMALLGTARATRN